MFPSAGFTTSQDIAPKSSEWGPLFHEIHYSSLLGSSLFTFVATRAAFVVK